MSLGVHMMLGETLMSMLRRVEAGETADDVYMEMFANAEHVTAAIPDNDKEDD